MLENDEADFEAVYQRKSSGGRVVYLAAKSQILADILPELLRLITAITTDQTEYCSYWERQTFGCVSSENHVSFAVIGQCNVVSHIH